MTSIAFDRRLLVMIALAAANHRLEGAIKSFIPVLPELITDTQDCAFIRGVLLLGLGRVDEARASLVLLSDEMKLALTECIEATEISSTSLSRENKV